MPKSLSTSWPPLPIFGIARISNALLNANVTEAKSAGLERAMGYVCQYPVLNVRSDGFLRRKGFNKIEDVVMEDDSVFRLYELKL